MPDGFRLPSPLYAIADSAQSRERPLLNIVEEMLEGGVRILQLRVKDRPGDEFFRLACAIRELTARSHCLLLVNDRIDIALAAGADGVHLGQEDLPIGAARPLMGKGIIGVSTHSIEQAREAESQGADYIGFGPLFGSQTKETGYAARGVSMLARVRQAVKIPIVAIGGITGDNVQAAWTHGADAAAMISYLTRGGVRERVAEVLHLAGSGRREQVPD